MLKKKSQSWYSREKNKQPITSRYLATVYPDIYIPSTEDKEQEKINAHQAIKDYLKDGKGYLSDMGEYIVNFNREITIESYE